MGLWRQLKRTKNNRAHFIDTNTNKHIHTITNFEKLRRWWENLSWNSNMNQLSTENYLYPVKVMTQFVNATKQHLNRRKFEKFLVILWKLPGFNIVTFSVKIALWSFGGKFLVSIKVGMLINFIKSVHSTI